MLKCENWDEKTMLQVEGNIIQVSADIEFMVHLIWEDLHRENPMLAETFKRIVQSGFEDCSIVWMVTDIQPDVKLDKSALGLLEMLKRKKEEETGEPGEPGVQVKADGDCSLEEMTRNAARMAMEKKEAESGESGT